MSAQNRSVRRIPSLPLADASTPASSSQARHRVSSSTLARSTSPPSHVAPSSTGSRSTPSSWGRKTQAPRRPGGFLLDGSGIGSLGGGGYLTSNERERGYRERDERERARQSHHYAESSSTHTRPHSEIEAEERDTLDSSDFPAHSHDNDPARIISLALGLSETRRRSGGARNIASARRLPDIIDEREGGNDFWQEQGLGIMPQVGSHVEFANTGGRARAGSPASFHMGDSGRRFVSASTIGGRQLSPLNPSVTSPPPPAGGATGKQHFSPVPSLPLPSPVAPYQQLQSMRSSLAQHQQRLGEFREQYRPSEATLLRALKAKQQLELSSLYKRLLTIYPHREFTVSGGPAHGPPNRGDGSHLRERTYNPLMAIRNKRIRNRERIKLELSTWDDPGAVEQWIEDVAVTIQDHARGGRIGLPRLPPPPRPSGRVEEKKRARLDWVISPQELLADFYWIESERAQEEQVQHIGGKLEEGNKREKQRETHLSLKSLIDREERARSPSQVRKRSIRDSGNMESGDEITRRDTSDSSKRRSRLGIMDRRSSLQPGIRLDQDIGYHSADSSQDSGHSSESEAPYDDETSGVEIDSDIDQRAKKKHSKRKTLGKIITSAKPSRRKKAKKKRISDTQILDPEEKRKRQEQEEMEWMVEMGDGIPGHRRSYSRDEGSDPTTAMVLARATKDKTAGVGKSGTGVSLPTTLGGSKSSLERSSSMGIPVTRRSLDFGEIVVPSIAISLSPPRVVSRRDDEDMDSRGRTKRSEDMDGMREERRKASPTKKLLEKGMEVMGRDREFIHEDKRKDSIESDAGRKLKDKDKDGSTMGRVKSRVEKIRNEVAKVEDFIWRRDTEKGGSALPSPTGSSFAEAESSGYRSEDDRGRYVRENTFSGSEVEDDARGSRGQRGRPSLEVPEGRALRNLQLGNHPSTSALPIISPPAKMGIEDDYTDISPDDEARRRRNPKSGNNLDPTRSHVSRDPSPARALNIQSVGDRNGGEIAAVAPRGHENGPRLAKHLPIVGNSDGKEAAMSKQELVRAKAYLLASGVVARGVASKRAGTTVLGRISNNSDGVGIVVLAKQHMYSADVVSQEIANAEKEFLIRSRTFTASTVVELKGLVDNIRHEIEARLATMLGEVADGADELNGELTTKCTLAVKVVNDDLSNVMRRKRRKFRWVRRVGYVMLEWVVLGVMWWVWLIVVIVRFLRVTVTGVIRGVRWILWI